MPLHIQCVLLKFVFHTHSTLTPFLCLVFWLVLVFVNSPIGPVYAHFTGDINAVPLILDITQKPS